MIISIASLVTGGCPRLATGYLVSVTAYIKPQPIDPVRSAILMLRDFDGPIKVQGSTLCSDSRDYRGVLTKSPVMVSLNDCYRPSTVSDTGWAYSIGLSVGREGLREEVRRDVDMLAEEIRKVVLQVVPDANVIIKSMEIGYGFSLLPY
jgi:hypothetical protein